MENLSGKNPLLSEVRLPNPHPLVIVSTGGWDHKLGTNHYHEQRADNKRTLSSKTYDTGDGLLKTQNT